jgi:DNA-3-methyladenine glycosylase
MPDCIPHEFYERDALEVSRDLLGMRLVRLLSGKRIAGIISETEAYRGEQDLASHARVGLTQRTKVMYGPPGHVYVYFTYGVHWCLNFVTMPVGIPSAVLIRAIFPTEGLDEIAARRPNRPQAEWANGPGKLTQALAIDGSLNEADLCAPDSQLWVEPGQPVPDSLVKTGPRIGINRVAEPWRSIPWRFVIQQKAWEPR